MPTCAVTVLRAHEIKKQKLSFSFTLLVLILAYIDRLTNLNAPTIIRTPAVTVRRFFLSTFSFLSEMQAIKNCDIRHTNISLKN